jgi:hypothetical protein
MNGKRFPFARGMGTEEPSRHVASREREPAGTVGASAGGATGAKGSVMVRSRSIWLACVTLGVLLSLLAAGRAMV